MVAGDARTPCPRAADRMGKGGPSQASCVLSALGRKEKWSPGSQGDPGSAFCSGPTVPPAVPDSEAREFKSHLCHLPAA